MVTGSRADYGLLRWLLEDIRSSPSLELQLIVTGMHLVPEFGLTWRDVTADGFHIDRKVETQMGSDTPVGIAKSIGLGVIGFADAFDQLRPDVVVVLGDRFEIFAAASAAMVARIPIAHIHGGETTEGAIDEALRHSITKMSQLHFVAMQEYRDRVVQLGEDPERVFTVGGLGVDGVVRQRLLDRAELENELGFELGDRSLLVTFHPVTLESLSSAQQMAHLLQALDSLQDTTLIFTMPNADTDGRVIIDLVSRFVQAHPRAHSFTSLGQLRYLSCLQFVDGVVGNSSSALMEAPSFKKGAVNIGSRQRGRIRASSVIDCDADAEAILAALERLYSPEFQRGLQSVTNPYGSGGASSAVVQVLETVPLEGLVMKSFLDVPVAHLMSEVLERE